MRYQPTLMDFGIAREVRIQGLVTDVCTVEGLGQLWTEFEPPPIV